MSTYMEVDISDALADVSTEEFYRDCSDAELWDAVRDIAKMMESSDLRGLLGVKGSRNLPYFPCRAHDDMIIASMLEECRDLNDFRTGNRLSRLIDEETRCGWMGARS
jgi:hypothetical protein